MSELHGLQFPIVVYPLTSTNEMHGIHTKRRHEWLSNINSNGWYQWKHPVRPLTPPPPLPITTLSVLRFKGSYNTEQREIKTDVKVT